jgi:hypothetical protein
MRMSNTEAGRDRDDPKTTTLDLRVTEQFLDDIVTDEWRDPPDTSNRSQDSPMERSAAAPPG